VRTVVLAGDDARAHALQDVATEREWQEEIGRSKRTKGIDWRSCADPLMTGGDATRAVVLGEEYGEACRAVLEGMYTPDAVVRQHHESNLRTELIQVAAVAVAWVEAIDARRAAQEGNEA